VGFVTDRAFAKHTIGLSDAICNATSRYAKDSKLPTLDKLALQQMSVPLEDVAGEMLCFGHDIWPASAREEEDPIIVPVEMRKPRSFHVPTRLMAVGIISAGTFGFAAAHKALDHDGDGAVTLSDLHATLDQVATGSTMHVQRKVVVRGVEKNATISWTIPGGYEVEDVSDIETAKLSEKPVHQRKAKVESDEGETYKYEVIAERLPSLPQ
jgi:hypothetical protein